MMFARVLMCDNYRIETIMFVLILLIKVIALNEGVWLASEWLEVQILPIFQL